MSTLISFHGKQEIKDFHLARLEAHRKADEIIKGTYWEKGKGCAMGCTVHSDNHSDYETELGISRILARLEDRIFEGMPNEDAKSFPIHFLSAIPVGVDLNPVWRKFLIWLLVDEKEGVIKHAKSDQSKKSIIDVAALLTKSPTEIITPKQYIGARQTAPAYAAEAVARANAAVRTDGAAAAAYASAAAAYASAAADAAAADAADRPSKYKVMADKLIELLKECKQ